MHRRRATASQQMVACIHGNSWPSVWAADECDCIDPAEAAQHLV
jgi:hypothetical protein